MKKFITYAALATLTLFISFNIGCSKRSEEAIDFGKFEDGVYANAFFNLKVPIPESWYVMDDETRIAIMQKGADIVAGKNKNLSAVMQAADFKNLNLISASESPPGSPVTTNPSLMILAENISHAPGIKRGSDYHFHTKKLMGESELDIAFPKDVYAETIDGLHFDVLDLSVNMGNMTNYQKQYAAIQKNYVLLIVINYQDDKGLNSLDSILQGTTFH